MADGSTVGDRGAFVDGEAIGACAGLDNLRGVGGCVAEGAPTCALDNDATDDPADNPGTPDDLAAFEQPASIPNAARPTPAHRRPRIPLL